MTASGLLPLRTPSFDNAFLAPSTFQRVQIVSVLLNASDESSPVANDAGFAGKNDTLALLGSLANAVAIGTEAGEDIDEIGTGSIELQVQLL